MTVNFNSEQVDCADGTNVSLFLNGVNLLDEAGIAVALNETVIPRAQWETTYLQENDSILIIQATQGG